MPENLFKYPKIPHFIQSQSITDDDEVVKEVSFTNNIIATIKMDGENCCFSRNSCHARSLDGRNHISRNWVKNLWGSVRYDIPENWNIFGENLYAVHSIKYNKLPTYFLVFSIFDENNFCLSWKETKEFCELLGLKTVLCFYEGKYNFDKIREEFIKIKDFDPSDKITKEKVHEGFVIRNAGKFHKDNWIKNYCKNVRKNHIKTDDHWIIDIIIPNILEKDYEKSCYGPSS